MSGEVTKLHEFTPSRVLLSDSLTKPLKLARPQDVGSNDIRPIGVPYRVFAERPYNNLAKKPLSKS